jgi:hypothetical protein
VWDTSNGELLARLPLPGILYRLSLHPYAPQMVCGDVGGAVHILEIVGLKYGPIIVTAWHAPSFRHLAFGCLHCRTWSEIPESALGGEIPCPNCGKPVKLNSFTIEGNWRTIAKAWRGGK